MSKKPDKTDDKALLDPPRIYRVRMIDGSVGTVRDFGDGVVMGPSFGHWEGDGKQQEAYKTLEAMAIAHAIRAESLRLAASEKNTENASFPRLKSRRCPTYESLVEYVKTRPGYDITNPWPWGCMGAAAKHFGVSRSALTKLKAAKDKKLRS